MKKRNMERIGRFLAGRGFYIVLFLCVAAIGISGYLLFSNNSSDLDSLAAAGSAQVAVPSQPIMPEASVAVPEESESIHTPTPTPTPTATPSPSPQVTPPSNSDTPTAAEANVAFVRPLVGEAIADFSGDDLVYNSTLMDWRTHDGIDLSAAIGDKVMAVSTGTVESIYADDLMGTTVIIAHGDGLQSVYSNLATEPAVKVGDEVMAGDTIGAVGTTAIAESGSVHLHFEMRQDGVPIDPATFLPDWSE